MKTWYTIYNISDGALRSHTSVLPAPLPGGTDYVEHPEGRKDQKGNQWNPSTLQWDPAPPKRKIEIRDFMREFTPAERFDYYSNHSANVQTFKDALVGYEQAELQINKDGPYTDQLMDLLVTEGVITAARKTEILS